MANPFQAIGSIPIMQTVTSLMQQQAKLRNQQILGDERQQLMQIRAQEMQERQATMKALQQDLQGGLQAQIDKTDIPSENDSPVMLAKKNVVSLQKQFDNTNATVMRLANTPNVSPEVIMQYRRESDQLQSRLIAANREWRLEQRNQAAAISQAAGSLLPDGSNFDQVMSDLREQDPTIDRKYAWDRDNNNQPVLGESSRRILSTLQRAGIHAKDQVDEKIKLDKAAEDAKDREDKRREEKLKIQKLESETAIAQVNAKRAQEGKPLLGHGEPKPTEEDASAKRLRTIADKPPTKESVSGATSYIRSVAKDEWPDVEFDDTLGSFAQSLAAKANEIRADAAKKGEPIDMDEARDQAFYQLKPFVKEVRQGDTNIPKDFPLIGGTHVPFTGKTMLSFRRAGVSAPQPKSESPTGGGEAKGDEAMLRRLNAVGLEVGITNGKVNGKGGPGNPVQLSFNQGRADVQYEALPSGTEFVGSDGVKRRKP